MDVKVRQSKKWQNKNITKKDLFDISSTKEFIIALSLVGGAVAVMSISPALLAAAIPIAEAFKKEDKKKQKKFQNSFYYLRKHGFITATSHKGDVSIKLTPKGKKEAKKGLLRTMLPNSVSPKKWDKKWRIVLFDIATEHRMKRDALRKMLKRIGMRQLQKSAWIYPFDSSEQVDFLKDFFSLSDDEVYFITAESIGSENKFKKIFKL